MFRNDVIAVEGLNLMLLQLKVKNRCYCGWMSETGVTAVECKEPMLPS